MGVCNPVVVRGQHFPSQKAAAEHFRIGQSAISQAFRKHGHLETVGLPRGQACLGRAPARPVETTLFGHSFPSRCAAARALGLRRELIRWVAEGRGSQAERERVYRALIAWVDGGADVLR